MLSEQHAAALVDQPLDPELLAAPVVEEGAGSVHLDLQPPLAVVVELFVAGEAVEADEVDAVDLLEEAHQQHEARRRHLARARGAQPPAEPADLMFALTH